MLSKVMEEFKRRFEGQNELVSICSLKKQCYSFLGNKSSSLPLSMINVRDWDPTSCNSCSCCKIISVFEFLCSLSMILIFLVIFTDENNCERYFSIYS